MNLSGKVFWKIVLTPLVGGISKVPFGAVVWILTSNQRPHHAFDNNDFLWVHACKETCHTITTVFIYFAGWQLQHAPGSGDISAAAGVAEIIRRGGTLRGYPAQPGRHYGTGHAGKAEQRASCDNCTGIRPQQLLYPVSGCAL